MIRKDLIESKDWPGFYLSRAYPNLVVNPDGRIIDIRLNLCLLSGYNGFWDYPTVNVRGVGTQQVHRIVAETFLYPPDDPQNLMVNHKDGHKENNHVENLEWCSFSENAYHAYQTGLRKDNRPIEVMDLLTGEREVFYSMQAAGRSLGINAGHIRIFLRNDVLRPLKGRFNLRYVDGKWKSFTLEHVYSHRHELDDVVAITQNGDKFLSNGLQSAIRSTGCTGCSEKDLRELVNKGGGRCSVCHSCFVYNSEYDGDREDLVPSGKKLSSPPRRKPKAIRVTNTVTNEVEDWSSTEEFAKSVGSVKNTIQKSVCVKNGRWKQYFIEYLD